MRVAFIRRNPFYRLIAFCGYQNENSIHWNVAVSHPAVGQRERSCNILSGRESKKWHQSEHSEEAAPGRGDIVKNNDSVQERIAYLTQRSSDTERDEHRTAELPVDHAISHPTLLIAAKRRKSEPASVTFCNFAPAKLKMMKKGRRTERFCRPRSDGWNPQSRAELVAKNRSRRRTVKIVPHRSAVDGPGRFSNIRLFRIYRSISLPLSICIHHLLRREHLWSGIKHMGQEDHNLNPQI